MKWRIGSNSYCTLPWTGSPIRSGTEARQPVERRTSAVQPDWRPSIIETKRSCQVHPLFRYETVGSIEDLKLSMRSRYPDIQEVVIVRVALIREDACLTLPLSIFISVHLSHSIIRSDTSV